MSDFEFRPRRPKLGNETATEIARLLDIDSIPYIALLRNCSSFAHYRNDPNVFGVSWLVNGLTVGTVEVNKSIHDIDQVRNTLRSVEISDLEWVTRLKQYTITPPVWIRQMYDWQNPLVEDSQTPEWYSIKQIRYNYEQSRVIECHFHGQSRSIGAYLALPMMENEIIPYFNRECVQSWLMPYTNAALYMKQIEMLKRCRQYDEAHELWNQLLRRLSESLVYSYAKRAEEIKKEFIRYLRIGTINIRIAIESERVTEEINNVTDEDLQMLFEYSPANRKNLVFLKVYIAGKNWFASIPTEALAEKSRDLIRAFLSAGKEADRQLVKITPRMRYDARDPILSRPLDPAYLENLGLIFMSR